MMDIQVERGIPIPPKNLSRPSRWPISSLTEVGMSFFVPFGDRTEKDQRRSLQTSLSATCTSRRDLGKFTVRQVDGGVRVWRTA